MSLYKKDERGFFWQLSRAEESGNWYWRHPKDGRKTQFGGHPYIEGDLQKYEIYEAEDFDDFVVPAFLEETCEQGWIDDTGLFWGCESGKHENVLYDVLKVTEGQAEERGWIKIMSWSWVPLDRSKLTSEQVETLKKIGRQARHREGGGRPVKFRDVYPNGYEGRVLPESKAKRVYPEDDPPVAPAGGLPVRQMSCDLKPS